mmetsp:Transcript_10637/g.16673  ORF Transcript_10637/g.16673 Transcript_10637/m.16673 type:complete len:211 (+) Transcript_10637:802-1434(+)
MVSAFVSLASGSSWGAMVLLFPIALPISIREQDSLETAGQVLIHTVGAVISGSLLGDHVSPISDTTVLSALSSSCELEAHVKTQAPYALIVATVAFVLTCLIGYMPEWAAFPLILFGVLILALVIHFLGTEASADQGSLRNRQNEAASISDRLRNGVKNVMSRKISGRYNEQAHLVGGVDDQEDRMPDHAPAPPFAGIELTEVGVGDAKA